MRVLSLESRTYTTYLDRACSEARARGVIAGINTMTYNGMSWTVGSVCDITCTYCCANCGRAKCPQLIISPQGTGTRMRQIKLPRRHGDASDEARLGIKAGPACAWRIAFLDSPASTQVKEFKVSTCRRPF